MDRNSEPIPGRGRLIIPDAETIMVNAELAARVDEHDEFMEAFTAAMLTPIDPDVDVPSCFHLKEL